MQSPEDIRKDQIAHARTTLGVKEGYERRDHASHANGGKGQTRPFKKHTPKGHDAILAKLQESREVVSIYPLNSEEIRGRIIGRDKFTITIKPVTVEDGGYRDGPHAPITFYKHGIEGFQPFGAFVPRPEELVAGSQQ